MTPARRYIAKSIGLLLSAALLQTAAAADSYTLRIDKVLAEYRALPASTDVRRLVALDRELNAVIAEIERNDKDGRSAQYWRKDYADIGVYIGHYSQALGYSGKLLVEAHARNPHSPYRAHTLFTTVLGEGTSMALAKCQISHKRNHICGSSRKALSPPRRFLSSRIFTTTWRRC